MTENQDAPRSGAIPEPEGATPPETGAAAGQPGPPGDLPPQGAMPPPGEVPPSGAQPSGAFAARYGLIRPRQPRVLAGVCGAIARATNTDPILWRVLLAVLAFFGGLGVLIYLVLWLGTPADGDTASPVEALFGRGRSATSPVLTVIAGVITLMVFSGITDNWHIAVLGAIAVVAVIAISGRYRSGQPSGSTQPWTPPPPAGEPPAATPAGYRPPFAPHGPYVTPTPVAPPAKPPKEQSQLGSVIFSVTLVVLGVLGMIDLAQLASIPLAGYVAAALATVGLGLIAGAWLGRARGMIALGIVLSIALAITSSAHDWNRSRSGGGEVSWQPATLAELDDRYEHQFGNATLDLRDLDFTGMSKDVTVEIEAGDFIVRLPENVDVTADARVRLGDATLFDRSSSGVRVSDFTVTDLGRDGQGGGNLRLTVIVTAGHAEVTR